MRNASQIFMRCLCCALIPLVIFWCSSAFGIEPPSSIYYVDDDGSTETGDGTEENPFATIQEGLDAALPGDVVLVADGTYTGTGNKNLDFGGKSISLQSVNGPAAATIDCEGDGRAFYFHNWEGEGAVVQGFTITGGNAGDATIGGAIYCVSPPDDLRVTSPTITQCVITGNTAESGGAFYLDSAAPTITNCVITGNTATSPASGGGGAIYGYCSWPTIDRCTFTGNTARPRGGAIYSDCSSSTITNCIFTYNEAQSSPSIDAQGGVLYCSCSSPTITNCTLTKNVVDSTAEDCGPAIFSKCSSATITNCILWENTGGSGITACGDICTCGGRVPTVTYSVVQGGYPGDGNIDQDPLFVTNPSPGNELGNLYLQESSPCIDAGDSDAVPVGITQDFAGNDRFFGSSCAPDTGVGTPPIVDMGAFEFQFLDEDTDGMEDCWEIDHFGDLDEDGTGDFDFDGLTDLWEFQNGTNPEINDAFQDADEDGFCNVRELLGGTDPNDEESTPLPTTIYVNAGATGSQDGSAAKPFDTIQEGINCAEDFMDDNDIEDTDIVQVANGTYTGVGNRDIDFKGKAITVYSENGPANCTVDCESAGQGFYFHRGEKTDSVLRGFTITNGSDVLGGGIHCGTNSSPLIDNCVITDNVASQDGGGVYCYKSSPVITNCTMSGNSSANGGGLYCTNSSLTLTNCTFSDNSVTWYGGALFFRYSTPKVMNCTVASNTAAVEDGGGGAYCKDSNGKITNTIFAWNTQYAVLEANANSDPAVTYCLFFENYDGDYLDENTTGYTGPNSINLNVAEAHHNVGGSPMFVDASAGDYHLQNGSYALDRGTKEGAPARDFEGDFRPVWPDPENDPEPPAGYETEPVDIGVDEADWAFGPSADTQAPVSYIEGAPSLVTMSSLVEIPWFASDAHSGVQGVDLWYRKDGGAWILYGSDFTINPIPFETSTTGGDGFYEFYTAARDNANNTEPPPDGGSVPTGATVVINSFDGSRIYVNEDASGGRTGASWTDACLEIGDAFVLSETFGVGEIWVAEGTYEESVALLSGVSLYGGFAGNETKLSNRDVDDHPTIIDVSTADEGSPASHGVVMDSVTYVVLDGFTITGGNAEGADDAGGGVYCNNLDSSNTIANCTVSSNAAEYGGGIYCLQASPTISDCVITNNTAEIHGGGIACIDNSDPIITHCTVSNNTANQSGGGGILCYSSSSPTISSCVVEGNTATDYDGGGILCSLSSSPTITNCVIVGNTVSTRYGGGIYARTSSAPTIMNCTIADNSAGSAGGGIGSYSASPTVTNCILWANSPDQVDPAADTPTVTFSDVQGGYPAGIGNIDLNPRFVGGGDYHLLENSPCIDAGTEAGAPNRDIDGHRRPAGAGFDIGADEFVYDSDYDGVPDEEEYGPGGNNKNYDGNNDGIPDSEQDNVVSLHTADGQNYVTLKCPEPAYMTNVKAVGNPSTGNAPEGAEFPYGFFRFTVANINPGGSTTVTLYLPGAVNSYYKYGRTPSNQTDHWYEFLYSDQTGAEINGSVVTLNFVDGNRGDDDLKINGTVVDDGAPALVIEEAEEAADTGGTGAPTPQGEGGGGGCFIGTLSDGLLW